MRSSPSGGLRTGSLFLRGKESWFLAISVERKAPRASRPLETCLNAASLCPLAAYGGRHALHFVVALIDGRVRSWTGDAVSSSSVSSSKPSSQSSLGTAWLRSAARPFRRKAVRGGSVSDSLSGFQRAASPLASFALWKLQKNSLFSTWKRERLFAFPQSGYRLSERQIVQ